MDLGIAGRVALVCASTSGLGLATAMALAAEGARVVISGRRGDVAAEIAAGLPGAIAVSVDLTEPGAPQRLVDRTRAELGEIDILVLNGGGPPPAPAEGLDRAQVTQAVELLLLPALELVESVVGDMRARGFGRILAVGSSGVVEPIPGLALSTVGRAALAGYLKTLATETAASGVTVNMLLPGRIATARTTSLDEQEAARTGSTVEEATARSVSALPAGRYGTPEEFGTVAAFLCSANAAYVTGTQIRVDGGQARGF